jgi:hypothetical protein
MLLFDPNKQELKPIYNQDVSYGALSAEAIQLRARLRAEHASTPDNEKCKDAVARRRKEPGCTMVIHRETGDRRKFDFSQVRRGLQLVETPSAQELSEQLLRGQWRIASLEEEQNELDRRALKERENRLINEQELRRNESDIARLRHMGVKPTIQTAHGIPGAGGPPATGAGAAINFNGI